MGHWCLRMIGGKPYNLPENKLFVELVEYEFRVLAYINAHQAFLFRH